MKPLVAPLQLITPTAQRALWVVAGALTLAIPTVTAQPFNINTTSRETVRVFYNRVYQSSEGVAIGWTGNIANCNPGTVSQAYQNATQLRVNWYRAMAGMPSNITFTEAANAKSQAAALMMSANRALNHEPPNTWTCFTELGREGAAANLNMGSTGPKSIDSFIQDGGDNNAQVGHRAWILLPSQLTMGSGHIPGTGGTDFQSITAALWVHDAKAPQRPATREEFVAWPPKGFVPYQTVYPRWSFALPGANYDGATVTMQRNGANVPVQIENRGGFGEPKIVWIPNGLNHSASWPRPTADEAYTVNINNVVVGGAPRNFTYNLTIFDPAAPGPDTVRIAVTGPDRPTLNQNTTYNFTPAPVATGYQWRVSKLSAFTLTDGAENGLANFDAVVGPYNPVTTATKAAGNAGFRLHRNPYSGQEQTLTLKRPLLASATSQITFKSRFVLASSYAAAVQVSTDNGGTWQNVFSEEGTQEGTPAFTDKVVSLAAFADRQIRVRFGLVNGSGGAFTGDNPGWFFDDITFANFHESTQTPVINNVTGGTSFGFNPTEQADFVLDVRPQVFGNYFEEWGTGLRVSTATTTPTTPTAPTITTQPQGQSVAIGANVTLTVAANGTAPLTYVWKRNGADLTDGTGVQGSRTATLTLQGVQAASAGSYTVQISNGTGNVTSTPAVLVVNEPPSLGTALDTTGLTWTTAGNANWTSQTAVTHDNVDAVQSGRIADGQESRLEVTVTGPATLAFWWKVDSEENYDWLRLDLDGTQQFRFSGQKNWEQKTVAIPAGTHTLSWAYSKDGSDSRGADAGWVDQVEVRTADAQPQTPPPPSLADALDTTGIAWTAAGDRPWFSVTATTHDGADAAQSGPITHSQASRLEATVLGPANLSFWWKVDSEQQYDFLIFELDNARPAAVPAISGNVNWEQKTVPIPAGTHTIRWSYTKDGSDSGGADAGWVDQVVLTRLTPGEAGDTGPKIEYTASGTKLRLTWPETSENFKLQAATSLSLADWLDVPEDGITKEDGQFVVIVNTSAGTEFYRLIEIP